MKTVHSRLKRIERETESMEPPVGPEEQDRIWDECHKENAREIREHAESAKGLLIKACQFMSALAGILPDPYCEEFRLLTEHLPVSSIEEVFRVIRRDIKKAPREIFDLFSPEPIASASIGQVHRARLRSNGEIVAVKVQHDGVDRVFLEDISTLSTIAEQVAYWMPTLDFRKFCQEWSESLPRELNFQEERRALERARSALRHAGNPVVLPRVYKKFTGQHVLVMEFIEAEPIMMLADAQFCERNNVDKKVVLDVLLNAFGIMAFKDGLFHADPHAGNVRVLLDKDAPGGAYPVLFDWGLFRELSDDERVGMAKVFHSVANFDAAGLFDVLGLLGYKFRPEVMTDAFRRDFLEKARGMMKDTVSKRQTREDIQNNMKEYKLRLEREGENANVSPIHFLEEWPRCIVFFMRMMQIVRGLCVAVDATEMPILDILTRHAREALVEASQRHALVSSVRMFTGREAIRPVVATPARSAPPAPLPNPARRPRGLDGNNVEVALDAGLEDCLKARLKALLDEKQIVGAQVAVVQNGRLVCDVASGTLSTIDARPIESSTRFPLMGCAAGLSALALIRTMRRQHEEWKSSLPSIEKALDLPVCDIWPQFSDGSSTVTLADLLGHAAGAQDAFPSDFGPSYLDDITRVIQHFEAVQLPKAKESRYAYLLQAFLLCKLGDVMAGKDSLLHWIAAELGPLGLDIAAPAGRGGEAAICRDIPQLSRITMSEVQAATKQRKARQVARGERPASDLDQDAPPELAQEGAKTQNLQGDSANGDSANGDSANGSSVNGASANGTAAPTGVKTLLEAIMFDPLTFDPLQANTGHGGLFRAGMSLGASARGLATALSSSSLQEDLEALHALDLSGKDPTLIGWILTAGACQWTRGGQQVFEIFGTLKGCSSCCLPSSCCRTKRQRGFGVACGLGPCVIHFPGLGAGGLTVAVTVNDVLRGRDAAAALCREVLSFHGYTPEWPNIPLRVIADARRLSQSKEGEPLMRNLGGMDGLRSLKDGLNPKSKPLSQSLLRRLGTWCSRTCCGGGRQPSPLQVARPVNGDLTHGNGTVQAEGVSNAR